MSKREYKRGPRAFLSGIALTIVAVVCVCLVLQAKKHTEEIIALNDAKDESVPAIFRQVPGAKKMGKFVEPFFGKEALEKDVLIKCNIVRNSTLGKNIPIFNLLKQNKNLGYLTLVSSSRGYSNPLILIVALDENYNLIKIDFYMSNETPGIADKLYRKNSNFLDNLNNLRLEDKKFDVKKFGGDFDYITGATVTSRAVVLGAKDALEAMRTIDFNNLKSCLDYEK